MKNKTMQIFGMSLNVLISIFLALAECFINDLSDSIIMDIVFILCGTFFSWIYITQQLGWNKGDISPFFYWALAIKRITLVGINSSEFIYFLFGFLNGIYSSKLIVQDQKMYYKKTRNAFQIILISVLIVYNFLTNPCNHQIILIISNIILLVLLGLQDNFEFQLIGSKQEDFKTNQRNSQAELKKCQTIIQQSQSKKSIWEQFNQITDDWICKIDIIKFKFNRTWESKEQSLVLQNFLSENKTNLCQFFNHMIIVRQSQNASIIAQFELQDNNTFLQWLEKNYLQETPQNIIKQKQFSDRQNVNYSKITNIILYLYIYDKININLIEILKKLWQAEDDQKSMLSPDRRYINQNDLSQDFSGLQPSPLNVDIQTPNNKTFLQCYLCLNQIVYNLSLSIFLVDDDKTNPQKQQSIIIQMKNVDKLIKSEILDQQRSTFYRYIGRLATHSGEVLKSVNVLKKTLQQQLKEFDYSLSFNDTIFKKSERHIGGISNPYQTVLSHTPECNTNQKLTSTHSNPHESQILNLQQLQIAYYQQSLEILKQIEKLNFDLIMMKQNNFNFFVLFSHTQLDIEQFNILSSFNIVKDIFQQNPILNQHNIIITQEVNHQTQVIIQSDKWKIKQILINIINNSIENFELNNQGIQNEKNENLQTQQQMSQKQDLKQQNMIIFKAHSDQDKIIIEISDNGGGIKEEMLKNRLNDCRFGLAATQTLLRCLAYDTQKPMEIINYVASTGVQGTVIKFVLPITRDNFQLYAENKQHESLIIHKRTDKI